MTEPKEPREFWVSFDDPLDDGFCHLKNPKYEDQIHVIEYSAYQDLQSELEKVKAELEMKHEYCVPKPSHAAQIQFYDGKVKQLQSELAAEKAKSKKLVEALENVEHNLDVTKRGLANIGIGNVALNEAVSDIEKALAEYRGEK